MAPIDEFPIERWETIVALMLTVLVVVATKAYTGRGTPLRGGYFRMKTAYLSPFPIPKDVLSGSPSSASLVSLVDTMLSLHKRLSTEPLPQRREQLQREIDQLVYQLYGLTEDEIRIVEEATR